jgi:hypothetical protein
MNCCESSTEPKTSPSSFDAGAYGYAMASNYNSKPLVAEVLIENGQVHLIRQAQTLDDVIAGESIPGRPTDTPKALNTSA